jgi:hypothetical protein
MHIQISEINCIERSATKASQKPECQLTLEPRQRG